MRIALLALAIGLPMLLPVNVKAQEKQKMDSTVSKAGFKNAPTILRVMHYPLSVYQRQLKLGFTYHAVGWPCQISVAPSFFYGTMERYSGSRHAAPEEGIDSGAKREYNYDDILGGGVELLYGHSLKYWNRTGLLYITAGAAFYALELKYQDYDWYPQQRGNEIIYSYEKREVTENIRRWDAIAAIGFTPNFRRGKAFSLDVQMGVVYHMPRITSTAPGTALRLQPGLQGHGYEGLGIRIGVGIGLNFKKKQS